MTYKLIFTYKQCTLQLFLCSNVSNSDLDFISCVGTKCHPACLPFGGTHLMPAVFFEQNSVVRVPELDSAVVRAAGAQLVLTGLATEGEA